MFEFAFVVAFGLIGGCYSWRVSAKIQKLEVMANVVSTNVPEKTWVSWDERYYKERL